MEYTIEKIQEEEAIFAGFSVKKTWKEMAEMFPGPVKAEKKAKAHKKVSLLAIVAMLF